MEMKKLISILFMLLISIGTLHCKAQSSAETFSINTFCDYASKYTTYQASGVDISRAKWKRLQVVKPFAELNASLLKAGFKCTLKRETSWYDDSIDEHVPYTEAQYSRTNSAGTIYVDLSWDGIHIRFPDRAQMKKFFNTVTANEKAGRLYSPEEYWLGVSIREEGNSIHIFDNFG